MLDPITTSIATALATATTAAATDAGRAVAAKITAFLRERFRRDPTGQTALEGINRGGPEPAAVHRLAELLDQRMRDDPRFAQRLRALWTGAMPAGDPHGPLTNTVTGEVHGSVIQARDIHGGITVNEPGRDEQDSGS